MARLGIEIPLGKVIFLNLVGVMAVVVHLVRVGGVLGVEGRLGARPAGIFPFSLGGKPIAVRAAVPTDILTVNGVYRRAAFAFAAGIAISGCIQPADIFHRQIFPGEAAGVASHNGFIFRLRQFIGADIKIAHCYRMLCLVLAAPCLCVRAAHLKVPAFHQNEIVRDIHRRSFGI